VINASRFVVGTISRWMCSRKRTVSRGCVVISVTVGVTSLSNAGYIPPWDELWACYYPLCQQLCVCYFTVMCKQYFLSVVLRCAEISLQNGLPTSCFCRARIQAVNC
jgi:hypothetical protein